MRSASTIAHTVQVCSGSTEGLPLTKNSAIFSINRLKSLHRQRRDVRLTVTFEELENCIPAPDETDSSVICAWLDEYLGTLTQLDRRLFVGRYWYNHSVKELARYYGLSANATTKRITRVREGLRAYLIERGYTP